MEDILENVNWANIFANLAEKTNNSNTKYTNNTQDFGEYFRDFINGFNKTKK